MEQLDKSYNFQKVEDRIYNYWLKKNFFKAKIDPSQKPFVIVLPPPNITGNLHIGHALNCTIQDILIRYHRLEGKPTLWLPGTDHAGIGMQVAVEKDLYKKTGQTKNKIGRAKFEKLLWQWKEKYGHKIIDEIKKLGASCDWTRQRFTMDNAYQKAVNLAFIHYYKKGYIYRGSRLINWCPRCQTVLSDLEIKYENQKAFLWYIKYPLKNEKREKKNYIIVATTRPETMLGDTAVAVNPKDKRYKKLVDKKIILPLMEREIPIIADKMVDMEFGTGAVKVTPAHDPNDYELGKKYKLEKISVIGFDGIMTSEASTFEGLKIKEARNKVIEELKKQGLLVKQKPYEHSVGVCDRCETIVEPLISKQWFVRMEELAGPAITAVKENKIKFIPNRWKKVYLAWMKNIHDWCISRQLWWGHEIPIWYCDSCDHEIASINKPKKCPKCNHKKFTKEKDVLDTWFSSALWPFATLGWPQKTKDLSYFYPTTVLVTGKDILYLWVARMIFSGLDFIKDIPFSDVYINATVLDKKGKKMSKSKGNIVDPLKLIDTYGADATRFGLVYQTSWGQDMSFQEDRILAGKKFCNKIWNASRFVMMNLKNINTKKIWNKNFQKNLTTADKKILGNLYKTSTELKKNMKQYRFGQAAGNIYNFFWHDFCDIYIEAAKNQMVAPNQKITTQCILFEVLESSLKILHPFIPFITEEIWQTLKKDNTDFMKKYYNYKYKMNILPQALIIAPIEKRN